MENEKKILLYYLMTPSKRSAEILKIISVPSQLHKFATMLTTDLNLFVKIIRNEVGSNNVVRMLGISEEINTIFFHPIIDRFTEIMTHKHSCGVALRAFQVCNTIQKSIFVRVAFSQTLVLMCDNDGLFSLEKVITLAEDRYKDYFLEAIAANAFSINKHYIGMSLTLHVLKLDFTKKTTEGTPRLHHVANEFLKERIGRNDNHIAEFHKFCSKLTSDRDLFVEFVKTRRGSLSVQTALGIFKDVDTMFLKAIDEWFPDIVTDRFGLLIALRIVDVFKKRGNSKVAGQIHRRIASNALCLTRNPMGNRIVHAAIESHDEDCILLMVFKLISHFVELSFEELGSNVLEKLLSVGESIFALVVIVDEFVACDEDTLVRLAKDEYGNKVLKKGFGICERA